MYRASQCGLETGFLNKITVIRNKSRPETRFLVPWTYLSELDLLQNSLKPPRN
jgi:hypothetical protein